MNSNHSSIGNGRLPFDVLIHVFDYYLDHETAVYPIETLLLVCKAWSEAACEHPSLWATYRIEVGYEKITKLWVHRIPLRLTRSGTQTPLYIDITSPPDKLPDDDSWISSILFTDSSIRRNADDVHTLKILDLLAGKNGGLCSRWRSLRLLLAPTLQIEAGEEELIYPLTYPMPALKSLHLTLRCRYSGLVPLYKRRELFPELPSLESITLTTFHMGNYPDMSHARKITFHRGWAVGEENPPRGLLNAPNVESLTFFCDGFGFDLPRVYLTLRTLSLTGPMGVYGLNRISMPQLEGVIIHFSRYIVLQEAANLQDIGRIRTLRLTATTDIESDDDHQKTSHAIGILLDACRDLQILRADNYVLSSLFKDWKHYLHPTSPLRVFLVKTSGEDREVDLNVITSTPGWNRIVELTNGAETES